MRKVKIWTKDFSFISATMFFVSMTFYLLMTMIPIYSMESFNASQGQAGLAAGIFIIGALVSRPLTGRYMEVIGRRRILLGSLILFFLATLLYFFVYDLNMLLVVRFVHGVIFGVATTAIPTVIMGIIPRERRGEGVGYFTLSGTMASAIGPFLGLVIREQANFTTMFVVCAVFYVISIIVTAFADIPEVVMTKEQLEVVKGFRLQDFFEKTAMPVSIVMLFVGMAYASILAFINSYALSLSLLDAAAFFFVIYSAFIIISRLFTGRLLDNRGDNIVMYPALLSFALSLVLISKAGDSFTFLLAGAFAGLGFGTIMSCAQVIAANNSPQHRMGIATSTFFFCADLGVGAGSFFAGEIVSMTGFRDMYMVMAIIVALSILLYYILHGRKTASDKHSAPGRR